MWKNIKSIRKIVYELNSFKDYNFTNTTVWNKCSVELRRDRHFLYLHVMPIKYHLTTEDVKHYLPSNAGRLDIQFSDDSYVHPH